MLERHLMSVDAGGISFNLGAEVLIWRHILFSNLFSLIWKWLLLRLEEQYVVNLLQTSSLGLRCARVSLWGWGLCSKVADSVELAKPLHFLASLVSKLQRFWLWRQIDDDDFVSKFDLSQVVRRWAGMWRERQLQGEVDQLIKLKRPPR